MRRNIVWTCVKAGYGLSIGVMGGLLTASFISHTLRDWTKKKMTRMRQLKKTALNRQKKQNNLKLFIFMNVGIYTKLYKLINFIKGEK